MRVSIRAEKYPTYMTPETYLDRRDDIRLIGAGSLYYCKKTGGDILCEQTNADALPESTLRKDLISTLGSKKNGDYIFTVSYSVLRLKSNLHEEVLDLRSSLREKRVILSNGKDIYYTHCTDWLAIQIADMICQLYEEIPPMQKLMELIRYSCNFYGQDLTSGMDTTMRHVLPRIQSYFEKNPGLRLPSRLLEERSETFYSCMAEQVEARKEETSAIVKRDGVTFSLKQLLAGEIDAQYLGIPGIVIIPDVPGIVRSEMIVSGMLKLICSRAYFPQIRETLRAQALGRPISKMLVFECE